MINRYTTMSSAFEDLKRILRHLPGIGYRAAEKMAVFLVAENPECAQELSKQILLATNSVCKCHVCGALEEDGVCEFCDDASRDPSIICVVENIQDMYAIDRSGIFRGLYHVLYGKISPIREIFPENLNFESLKERLNSDSISEIILALSCDIEGESTCQYIKTNIVRDKNIKLTRIAFGVPYGSGLIGADSETLNRAISNRNIL